MRLLFVERQNLIPLNRGDRLQGAQGDEAEGGGKAEVGAEAAGGGGRRRLVHRRVETMLRSGHILLRAA